MNENCYCFHQSLYVSLYHSKNFTQKTIQRVGTPAITGIQKIARHVPQIAAGHKRLIKSIKQIAGIKRNNPKNAVKK